MNTPSFLNKPEIFTPGYNCWKQEKADFLSIVVDYGNYYRDLHESIVKARHSIFILGWDIDSRIELLRGEHAENSKHPVTLFDLLCWKAKENPEIQIYLNKWNYSFFFMKEREPLWEHKWKACGHNNIHICLDGMIPLGACHHQKIAVIDDETVYWGGMDVALGRWDFRDHHVKNPHRADPCGFPSFDGTKHFHPYHDIQAVMSGPAARSMARLVRDRWEQACDTVPILLRGDLSEGIPPTWPDSDPPDFENIDVAISRTIPKMGEKEAVLEIKQAYLDEISQAENFIYIENQFLCSDLIAKAINQQLHRKPNLRVLLVSCYEPQGIMERKSMWGGRVKFRDLIEADGVADRVAMVYPMAKEDGETAVVRIHSKLMIIDDKYMHLGSSNINNRSFGMDTECDVSLIGNSEKACRKIAAVRTDLIREHCGREAEEIDRMIDTLQPVSRFLEPVPHSTQHLKRIDDEVYRTENFVSLARKIADPKQPFIGARWTTAFHHGAPRKQLSRNTALLIGFILLCCLIAFAWKYTPLSEYASIESLEKLFSREEDTVVSYIWVTALYVICSLLFMPVTVLSAAMIVIFGGVKGVIISLIGAMLSSLAGYQIGQMAGPDNLKKVSKQVEAVLNKISNLNVMSVAVVRTLPLAPFSVVNLVFGVSNVSMMTFLIGTLLGLLPGKITLAFMGESISDLIHQPTAENITYVTIGFMAWIGVMVLCNRFAQKWQNRHSLKQATC